MDKLIKGNKKFMLLVLIIITLAFYWFGVRPSQLKKECGQYAQTKLDQVGSFDSRLDWKIAGDDYYRSCLREKGIND